MKRIIYSKFDKRVIGDLPQVLFPGKIVSVISESEADKAVAYLLSCDILGVDTETKPTFRKGQNHKVSLLQVASKDICFLFRLNRIGITDSIKKLLENKKVPMVGLSWHDDILSLHKRREFSPGYFIDLQNIVGEIGIKDLSLQKLYANIFHQKISKRQRLTNWDADILTERQREYAATDAWTCINLYEEIKQLKATKNYELVVIPEPVPTTNIKEENQQLVPQST